MCGRRVKEGSLICVLGPDTVVYSPRVTQTGRLGSGSQSGGKLSLCTVAPRRAQFELN